jgi:putative addiction module component (TIGR02574 family)
MYLDFEIEKRGSPENDKREKRELMQTFEDVLDAARTLTPTDRNRLLESLWEAIPSSDWPHPSEEWIAEAQRRSAAYDRGESSAASWREVKDRARRQAGLDE